MAMGEKIEHFSLPVCTKFVPVILEGQLCYQVDVNNIKIQDGKSAAKLTFLIDYNEDRNTNDVSKIMEMPSISPENLENMGKTNVKNIEALIYIETIGIRFNSL